MGCTDDTQMSKSCMYRFRRPYEFKNLHSHLSDSNNAHGETMLTTEGGCMSAVSLLNNKFTLDFYSESLTPPKLRASNPLLYLPTTLPPIRKCISQKFPPHIPMGFIGRTPAWPGRPWVGRDDCCGVAGIWLPW